MKLRVVINVDVCGHLQFTEKFVKRDMAGNIANHIANILTDNIMANKWQLEAHGLKTVSLVEGVEQFDFGKVDIIVRHGTENALVYKKPKEWDYEKSLRNRFENNAKVYSDDGIKTVDLSVLIRDRASFKARTKCRSFVLKVDELAREYKTSLVSALVFDEFDTIVKANNGKYDVDFEEMFIDVTKKRAHTIIKYLYVILKHLSENGSLEERYEELQKQFSENLAFDQADGLSLMMV